MIALELVEAPFVVCEGTAPVRGIQHVLEHVLLGLSLECGACGLIRAAPVPTHGLSHLTRLILLGAAYGRPRPLSFLIRTRRGYKPSGDLPRPGGSESERSLAS